MSIGVNGQILHKFDHVKLDSLRISNKKFINKIFQQAVNSVKKDPDTSIDLTAPGKSITPFLPYEGKIIRRIYTDALDFERSFADTGKRHQSLAGRIANSTHTNTRFYVIKNNLFIKENTPLDPYKVADNERYLRTLDYINDARIIVVPVNGDPDSVDIKVITKDFFALSGGASSDALNHIHANVVDANIGGTGQRVELSGLFDYTRSPNWGYGILYRNNSIGNTFINGTGLYSTININPNTGEEEHIYGVSFLRPLVSPYAKFAGGVTISHNEAYNLYSLPDSLFYKYEYYVYDWWMGYNLPVKRLHDGKKRERKFFAIRYFNFQFNQVPKQVNYEFNPVYNTRQGILGQLTLFKQEYYKTQYIYGFGTTEDLPYGYNLSMVGGWVRQLDIERPYGGILAQRYIATNKGDFIQLFLRSGCYYNDNSLQDASILLGGTVYSRLFFLGETKIRQYLSASFTRLYNRLTYSQLRIDNDFGIRGFTSDSAYGNRRISLQTETEFYLKYKVLGFKFAPFPYVDLSLITPENKSLSQSQFFASIGGGVRARNENLIFETIELRFYYFPNTVEDMKGFKVVLSSNIKFRYNSNYVNEPDIIHLNQDINQ
jgi:hypothetical protein